MTKHNYYCMLTVSCCLQIFLIKKNNYIFFQPFHQIINLDLDQSGHFVDLIWVQTVFKNYRPVAVGKELNSGFYI